MPLLFPSLKNSQQSFQPKEHSEASPSSQNEERQLQDTLGNMHVLKRDGEYPYTTFTRTIPVTTIVNTITYTTITHTIPYEEPLDDQESSTSIEAPVSSPSPPVDFDDVAETVSDPIIDISSLTHAESSTTSSEVVYITPPTATIIDMPSSSSSTWSTSYTSANPEPFPTSTMVTTSGNLSLKTVEWIGVGVGAASFFIIILVTLSIVIYRRRRGPGSTSSENNGSVSVLNSDFFRYGSSRTARTQTQPSEWTDSRELKTTGEPASADEIELQHAFERPIGSSPPNYGKYWTRGYHANDLGARDVESETPGSRYGERSAAQGYSSSVYSDPKWKGKQREEF
ncbi:hypothetical protein F66182_3736 [Fusarium sp. NRRL 66182]|nr:hypothetical protein F66182_3736 [Fusarium sp. NRRL 66182]